MDLALSGPFQSNENLNSHLCVLFFLAVYDEAKHIINAITVIFQPMKPNTVKSSLVNTHTYDQLGHTAVAHLVQTFCL